MASAKPFPLLPCSAQEFKLTQYKEAVEAYYHGFSKQQDSIYNGLKIEVQLIASKAVRLWYSYSAKLSRICLCTPNQPQPSGEHQHDYRGAS